MPKAKDVTGQRFGRLVAVDPVGKTPHGKITWLCQCDCGNTTVVIVSLLSNGHTQSCGCLFMDMLTREHTTHGMTGNYLYSTWANMIQRCTSPKIPKYVNYGGRGISVCEEWRCDFKAFHDYVSSLPNCKEKGYSLDRIDNEGNYEPGNVKWSTRLEQNNNSRNIKPITFNGITMPVLGWVSKTGIPEWTLRSRLRRGWSIERTLTTPIKLPKSGRN